MALVLQRADTGTWTGENWSDDAEFTQEDKVNTELARTLVNTTGDADTTLKFGSELEDGVDTNVWCSIESVSGVWPHFWMIVGIGTCGVVTRCAHFTQHRMVIKKNRRVSSMLVSRHVRTLSGDSKYPFSFCV